MMNKSLFLFILSKRVFVRQDASFGLLARFQLNMLRIEKDLTGNQNLTKRRSIEPHGFPQEAE